MTSKSVILASLGLAGVVACGADHASDGRVDPSGATPPPSSSSPAPPVEVTQKPDPPKMIEPDTFAPGDVDVVSMIRTGDERRPISPLIYGINAGRAEVPADVMRGVTFVRRGGDISNAYNWETNVTNGAAKGDYANDMRLTLGLESPNAPGEVDRALIADNLAAGRGTMVPFVLNDYVAGPVASGIPFTTPGFDINQYFHQVEPVKPTPFAATPDLNDGVVYTDEHIAFLRSQFEGDILAPGPTQVMVGTDNEPDLYDFNFPMLQRGSGAPVYYNGVQVGTRVTGTEFTAKLVRFAKRVKQMAPGATIVGPDHYHYDGWTSWHGSMPQYSDAGRWYMDDFLETVRGESEAFGARLLDTWDFHWYPQRVFDGTYTWALDDAARPMTEDEIEAVIQGPRSYWDHDYDEHSWITDDHLLGPAYILERLLSRLDAGYPGTTLGVTEYFPGGCAHVSSGLATADTLGVFGRMGVHVAAMWPHTCDIRYALGALQLLRNADGNGLAFAGTSVAVDHPEKEESSLFAASDDATIVTVLVVNKTKAPRRFGLRVRVAARLTDAVVYRIDAANPTPSLAAQEPLTGTNIYAYSAPAMSAALVVLRSR